MKMRQYIIWTNSDPNTKRVKKYMVADADNGEELDSSHPAVAEFPVNGRYDADTQRQRAQMYAEYMNKIVEATKVAYEQTQLCNILKA